MKLIRLDINAFGKLKDFTLQPQEGLNTYIHPNEYGKTTLIQQHGAADLGLCREELAFHGGILVQQGDGVGERGVLGL